MRVTSIGHDSLLFVSYPILSFYLTPPKSYLSQYLPCYGRFRTIFKFSWLCLGVPKSPPFGLIFKKNCRLNSFFNMLFPVSCTIVNCFSVLICDCVSCHTQKLIFYIVPHFTTTRYLVAKVSSFDQSCFPTLNFIFMVPCIVTLY